MAKNGLGVAKNSRNTEKQQKIIHLTPGRLFEAKKRQKALFYKGLKAMGSLLRQV